MFQGVFCNFPDLSRLATLFFTTSLPRESHEDREWPSFLPTIENSVRATPTFDWPKFLLVPATTVPAEALGGRLVKKISGNQYLSKSVLYNVSDGRTGISRPNLWV